MSGVLLVRHTEVARAWRGRCYGSSDMGLSRAGIVQAREVAAAVAAWRPAVVVHSGLRRAAVLAGYIAAGAGAAMVVDGRWRERDFGTWEGQSWAAIYRATGDAMDGMMDAPAVFRPGGGETTMEMAARAAAALADLPEGRVVVVSHGGPIAALTGRGRPVAEWTVPGHGAVVEM